MVKKWTHSECFASYGTVPKNPRWSWSGRSPDGEKVSVTLWQDRFEDGVRLYRSVANNINDSWVGSNGHNELIENLAWAEDHCNGIVHLIIAIPKDRNASPRSISECFPKPDFQMRISKLDRSTGDFELHLIE